VVSSLLKEFKEFINRGNIVELAVAFVLGVAFVAVVNSLVNDVILQLIAVIVGQPSFDTLTIDINDSTIRYGRFLTQVLSFLLIAFSLFLIVKAYNRFRRENGEDPATPKDIELLTEIRDALVNGR
jgi:large conductance mechanosensitive channel